MDKLFQEFEIEDDTTILTGLDKYKETFLSACHNDNSTIYLAALEPKHTLVILDLKKKVSLKEWNEMKIKWFSLEEDHTLAIIYRSTLTHNYMYYFVVWNGEGEVQISDDSWEWELPEGKNGQDLIESIYGDKDRMKIVYTCNSSWWFLVDNNRFLEQEQLVNFSRKDCRIFVNNK